MLYLLSAVIIEHITDGVDSANPQHFQFGDSFEIRAAQHGVNARLDVLVDGEIGCDLIGQFPELRVVAVIQREESGAESMRI